MEILREKLAQAKLPEEAQAEADRELGRLAKMHPSSSEYHVITTYLDWMINLPWEEGTVDHLDIKPRPRAILNRKTTTTWTR